MYDFYLDKILLPISPPKLKIKISNQNKTLRLINQGEVNLLKKAGLTEISFTILLPQQEYPFARFKNGFQAPDYYLGELEKLKVAQEPFQFIVTRQVDSRTFHSTNIQVSLEEYEITEDAEEGFDISVEISLKQYSPFGTKSCEISLEDSVEISTTQDRETVSSPAPSTNQYYTVQSGDCLWTIAKAFYGNGSLYTKISQANPDISNPNLIYPGQELIIPA